MAMDSTESTLLSKLQSPDLTNIHHLFSTYLHPFSAVTNKSKKQPADADLRSLAKKFITFLNRTLSLLPKRLSESPKIDSQSALQLFDTYKLCLSCLDSISSQLSCKPYSVHTQKVRLIHCLENWCHYGEAITESLSVLKSLTLVTKTSKSKSRIVPDVGKGSVDKDLALLIVEIVVTLVKCTSLSQSKDEGDYLRILTIIDDDEIQPWFRLLDVNECERLHRLLVTYLSKCTLLLVGELACFDGNLVRKFCLVTFRESAKSSVKDQRNKFARRICYTLFSQQDNLSSFIVDIVICVLDYMAGECKVIHSGFEPGMEKIIVEFLELVCYCANKCRTATTNVCGEVAKYFNKLAGDFCQVSLMPFDLVMRLYAIGLYISGSIHSETAKDTSMVVSWLNEEERLQTLTAMLGLLTQHCDDSVQENDTICTLDQRTYMMSYYSALNFLCEPLSEFVNSERKEILAELEGHSILSKLSSIQDAFHSFCNVFDCCYRCNASDREREIFDDTNKTVLTVAVAAFTLSLTTKRNVKESVNFLRRVTSADWIQANGLKFLFASLYNVGVVLYRTNRMKEASKALKLCCKAAWTRVLYLSKTFVEKTDGHNDLSEDGIEGFVEEACSKSAFLLDVLYQCGSDKTDNIIADCLESWSVAKSLFKNLPKPISLVKQWVRIRCKLSKDADVEHCATTLYSLLSSSEKVSKRTLGMLLELVLQELQAYKEMNSLNPELCKKMQTAVISILLKKVYITKDSRLQKSRILIAKARESRASGVEGLNDSIQYLSEAISTMNDLCGETPSGSVQVCNQLANAYCLRALCTQEAEPNSKELITDIKNALKNWLSLNHNHQADQNQMVSENTFILLYHVADLLSMKGYMDFQSDMYEMTIRLFEWKNIPLEKWLATLWQSRRLGHALCASPVDEAFITALSEHYRKAEEVALYEVSKSMEFWISCMKKSQSLLVGFQQNFSFMFNIFSSASYHHDHVIQSDVTIEEVKQAASDLISRVPLSSSTIFLAARLYYDLSERLISNGLLNEALSYSKEAHRLRSKLFQEKFMYSIEQQNEIVNENEETVQKSCYSLKAFHMHPSVATSAWPYDNTTYDFEGCILTPWSALQCYLESTLQVGTIHEIVGNGSEAETLLLWGKNISSFQGLSLFVVAFSSVLGKLYLKQRFWDLAKKELQSAKQVLDDNYSLISCLKCRLVFEVTVDQQLGDLSRSLFNSNIGEFADKRLLDADDIYRSALRKLNTSEWKNPFSNPEEASASSEVPLSSRTRSQCLASMKRSKSVANSVEIRCEVTCACNKMNCWHCLVLEVMKSRSLYDFVLTKWELVRRRLLLRLLTGIGKCFGAQGKIHEACEKFLESISLLVSKCTTQTAKSSIPFTFLLDFIEKDAVGDVFAVEHASLLYNVSWFTLQSFPGKGTSFCGMPCIPIPRIVSWLMLAFIRCCEVPVLFQKVSRLLAVIYTLSTSVEAFSMSHSPCNAISESQWASYFHQASLGCHLNHQLLSRIIGKQKLQNIDVEGPCLSSSTTLNSLRLAPELLQDLEEFVLSFFQGLPRLTIICISLLGHPYASLLRDLLLYPSPVQAWILLSRLNANGQPVVIFLPVDSVLEEGSDDDESSSSRILCEETSSVRQWQCPWGYTVVDDVAPVFKLILEENYLSSSAYPLEDTKENRVLWWMHRKRLDQRLGKFLRDLEDSWFGPWKYLFLGEWSDCKLLDSVQKKLADDLKSKCKIDVDEGILKSIIGGAKYACQSEECLSKLILKKGCYAGGIECCSNGSSRALAGKRKGVESLSPSISKLILESIYDVEVEDSLSREPIVLVLDFDVQMLPWENLPVLRSQEVYRMPSVGSISSTLDRCCQRQERNKDSLAFPLIDPLDAYYLLNPGGDLSSTEAEFGKWFRDQNLEGKAGTPATVEELTAALSSHDLFIYFGHGSGAQYIPGHEIQKLESCAATFLMGCSSGSISLNGSYTPHGAPLYYLMAGSPVIVANLWEVTDKDIDRFGKAMLDAWLRERSNASTLCAQCSEITGKIKAMNINGTKRNAKKKASRKKLPETCEVYPHICCEHRPKIGSFMGQAREACTLPFLIGASPVCYGVPTGIRKKDS